MKRWSDLSERNRRIITVVAIVEAALKAAMLMDLKRRPADQVKGSKRVWAFSTIVNSAGIIPLAVLRLRAEARAQRGLTKEWWSGPASIR